MVVVYVPTEANLPIMEAGRLKDMTDQMMKKDGKP